MSEPRHRLFRVASRTMVVYGVILALPGTVLGLPDYVASLGVSLAGRGVLLASLFAGLFAGSLLSGAVVDRFGHRIAIAVASGAVALLLPVFTVVSSLAAAVAVLAGLGLTSATLNTAANALASAYFPDSRGRRANILAIAFGIGGLSMPAVTGLASGWLSWKTVVVAGALVSVVNAVVAFRISPLPSPGERVSRTSLVQLLRQRQALVIALLVACGAAAEATMAGWTSSYLGAQGFSAASATLILSSHWVGLIAARTLLARHVDREKRVAIAFAATVSAGAIALFIGAPVPGVLLVLPFVIGMTIAVIVPTALALGGERLSGSSGARFAFLLTVAQVGGMTLPALVGAVADRAGLRIALSLLLVDMLAIALLARKLSRRAG